MEYWLRWAEDMRRELQAKVDWSVEGVEGGDDDDDEPQADPRTLLQWHDCLSMRARRSFAHHLALQARTVAACSCQAAAAAAVAPAGANAPGTCTT